jgi:hypothetical protein
VTLAAWANALAPTAQPVLGLYTDANSTTGIDTLASTLGVKVRGYSFYVAGGTWSSISNPWSGTATGQPPTLGAGQIVLLSVPLTPNNTGLSSVPSNLSTFRTLATNLVGTPTIVRLGWEFDGNWFPWGNGVGTNTAAQYVTAWQDVIPAMRANNAELTFDWSANIGTSNLTQLETFYPGDFYVDYIGGDYYDNNGSGGNTASNYGPVVNLANARGKPLSTGEWGLNGTDDPTFINNMAQLFLRPQAAAARYGWPAYSVAYQSYFSFDGSNINSDITQFPNAKAAYTADFG